MFNRSPIPDDVDTIIWNWKQDELGNRNYCIGALRDQESIIGSAVPRIQYDWNPILADTPEESCQIQRTKVREDCIFEFSKGSIERHYNIKMLMPDTLHDITQSVLSTQAGIGENQTSLSFGTVINQIIYQQQSTLEMFRIVAEEQPDQLEKMKELTMQSDMDEQRMKEMTQILDNILAAVNRNSSNSNS